MSIRILLCCLCLTIAGKYLSAAEVFQITADANDPTKPARQTELNSLLQGKEVDWIFGDYVLKNDQIAIVIGNPVAGRNANMTVRGVGACIIDAVVVARPNDQLSAYYPTGTNFPFNDPQRIEIGVDDGASVNSLSVNRPMSTGSSVYWRCKSTAQIAGEQVTATVTYRLQDGQPYALVDVQLEGATANAIPRAGAVRADRTFDFQLLKSNHGDIAYCRDEFFGATYGFATVNGGGQWGEGRQRPLEHLANAKLDNAGWQVRFYPATSAIDLHQASSQQSDRSASWQHFKLSGPIGGVSRALATIEGANLTASESNAEVPNQVRADDEGMFAVRLMPGTYDLKIQADGYESVSKSIEVTSRSQTHEVSFSEPSILKANFTDLSNNPIPCKLTIYGADGTSDPNFGPDSAAHSIVNCVYCVHGTAVRPIQPGKYDVLVTYGPEYDLLTYNIEVKPGQVTTIAGQLKRTVDTTGWVSAELHSHSTPSGDNTADQVGRVENHLCEHLEFVPCTEHNRIDSYEPILRALNATHLLATCTGMELTGSLLPANHQNAFPLIHHPHYQDGGGPQTDVDPVVQIERLAMWDNGADKIVQGNHPNFHQVYGDKDVDGNPDEGFRKMLSFMDVVEVHPLESILTPETDAVQPRDFGNRILRWMKLLNDGHKIPGVVNTDAHYNHHGTGWIRNWFRSETDIPSEIKIDNMIHAAEHGHILMSTGPYMEVSLTTPNTRTPVQIGDSTTVKNGDCTLTVRVQCPNWLDVNRIQVLVNGRLVPELDFRRRTHADWFSNDVVKFDREIPMKLTGDSHLIVVAVGEGLELGRSMGPEFGKLPPIAVTNPIYCDVDGNGFQHNHDDLGYPLPRSN